jgi:transcriptional antiterminator NusG
MSDKKWYTIHTYSGHENKVKANIERAMHVAALEDSFGEILVPIESITEIKDGVKKTTKRKMFPSYVFIEMAMSNESRHLVQNVPGVTAFVSDAPLKDAEVKRLRGEKDGPSGPATVHVAKFKVGDQVRITDGPFNAFTGVVDEVNNERGKVKVMVSIFGRATPVELDFLQVIPV